MKKLSTHIKGLDALFHGGIQVTSVTNTSANSKTRNVSKLCADKDYEIQTRKLYQSKKSAATPDMRDRDGLIIIIRGSRGVNKHLFAMQLMHGLGMSIYDICHDGIESSKYEDSDNIVEKFDKPGNDALRYYSINKPTHLLEDMYLDLLIERWISHTNIEYKELVLKSYESDQDRITAFDKLNKRTNRILNTLFEPDSNSQIPKLIKAIDFTKTAQLFAENIIGYNARTNSIHFRTISENDNSHNCLFKRRKDKINEYHHNRIFCAYEYTPQEYYNFKSEFLNVKFNTHLCKDHKAATNSETIKDYSATNSKSEDIDTYESVRNAHSARVNFFSILNSIENILEENDNDLEKRNKEKGNDRRDKKDLSKYLCEAVVIDGFSHISEKDLQSLPYNHLLNCLRKLSRISILVFENTQNTMPDGDIEIEIRSNYDDGEEYTFNEIRIAKCVNQITSLGWHLYKRQESHIRIYPSLHLNLFKRSYINNQMHELGLPIIKDSYATQIRSEHSKGKSTDELIDSFIANSNADSFELLDYLLKKAKKLKDEEELSEADRKEKDKEILEQILSSKWQDEKYGFQDEKQSDSKKGTDESLQQHNHCPITTIVGNLNSHKRNIALYSAFSKAHEENTHVLIVLLDKDPIEMRKKILCPGIFSSASKLPSDGNVYTNETLKERANKCTHCYEKISFLNVNSGCIPPEEFLSMLKDHISVYTGEYKDRIKVNNDKKRNLHIIFDDYHRIDFSYPFLSSSNLFTTALISLCEKMGVGLTILCDKDSKRVREVCTLSDYVLCVQREVKDTPRKVTLYTERNGDDLHIGTIIKYTIKDALDLMACEKNPVFTLNGLERIERIGSMKEYWRQKYNTFQPTVQSENEDDSDT
jgi:ATP-dependent protease HslVU (ClpYQ) peptidase subunit